MSRETLEEGNNRMMKLDEAEAMDNFDDIDPINAYLKQRHSKSRSSIFSNIESDSDYSIGVLDIDNISLLDDIDEFKSSEVKLQESLNALSNDENIDAAKPVLGGELRDANPFISKYQPTESELNLMKQRELAKKTLLQLNSKLERINQNLKSLDKEKAKRLQTKAETGKTALKPAAVKEVVGSWLEQNQSPQTPRFFKDELNSINECEAPLSYMKDYTRKSNILSGIVDNGTSFDKLIGDSPPISMQPARESDLGFKPQSKGRDIHRPSLLSSVLSFFFFTDKMISSSS